MLVEVYRNLNKKCWSIRYRNKVIAYADAVIGFDGKFVVRETGRQRTLKEGKKNVHAFCRVDAHTLVKPEFRYDEWKEAFDVEPVWRMPQGVKEVTYNPFEDDGFVLVETGRKIWSGSPVYMMNDMKVYIR